MTQTGLQLFKALQGKTSTLNTLSRQRSSKQMPSKMFCFKDELLVLSCHLGRMVTAAAARLMYSAPHLPLIPTAVMSNSYSLWECGCDQAGLPGIPENACVTGVMLRWHLCGNLKCIQNIFGASYCRQDKETHFLEKFHYGVHPTLQSRSSHCNHFLP